jgi:uncharacterized protein YcnI
VRRRRYRPGSRPPSALLPTTGTSMHPSLRRTCAAALLAIALLLSTALPASAHASFEPAEVGLGSTVDLSLLVPNERGEIRTVRVETLVPVGWVVETCGSPTGWTCATNEQPDGSTVVDWGVDGPDAAQDEPFELTLVVPADAPEVVAFPTVQTYEDGEESTWVDEGEPSPAPTLVVTGGAAAPTEDATAEPSPAQEPSDPTAGATDAPTAEPTDDPTDDPTDAGAPPEEPTSPGAGVGVLPLLLGATAVALLVAVAVALSRRRERGPTA